MSDGITGKDENMNNQKLNNNESAAVDNETCSDHSNAQSDKEACVSSHEQDIEKLMAAVEEKKRLFEELNERYKRLQADFDNFRRRSRSEKEELSRIVTEGVILQLLPVIDNFERALISGADQDAAKIMAGIEMIYRQFSGILDKLGVTPIQAVGEQFDPQKHEAVMRVDDADLNQGIIVEELQKGYMTHGKVIRPSMVKVVG